MKPILGAQRIATLTLLATFLFLFTTGSAPVSGTKTSVEKQTHRTFVFKEAGVRFNNDFSGARLNECTQTGDSEFRILIRPENKPVNDSAWYAFQVVAKEPKTITVTLAYEGGKHRYKPKTSFDGVTWTPLTTFTENRQANEATLKLEVGTKPLTVASQEMIGVKELNSWMSDLARNTFVKKSAIGKSILKQPIQELEINESKEPNYIFIVGRQHPPEITGSMGLMRFTEVLAGDSELAEEYRKHFRTIVIPLMNPDGVREGHWRHNMNGVDLNRDWKHFLQPETRAVRDIFVKLSKQRNARVFLLLDFHSTQQDRFYTATDAERTFPENFTAQWLGAIQQKVPDYKLRRDPSYEPNGNTSKVWGYQQFGCPSITYELGDQIDREQLKSLTCIAAEEMMRLLVEALSERSN
ncbi:MAG: M14 family zinc carboxypeptidase [Verrucomicrobiota bacterium]